MCDANAPGHLDLDELIQRFHKKVDVTIRFFNDETCSVVLSWKDATYSEPIDQGRRVPPRNVYAFAPAPFILTTIQVLPVSSKPTLSCGEITHVWGDVVGDHPELGLGQRKSLERLPAGLRVGEWIHSRIRAVQHAFDAELSDARRDLP